MIAFPLYKNATPFSCFLSFKSKKQAGGVPTVRIIFDGFWPFHSPKWERSPSVRRAVVGTPESVTEVYQKCWETQSCRDFDSISNVHLLGEEPRVQYFVD